LEFLYLFFKDESTCLLQAINFQIWGGKFEIIVHFLRRNEENSHQIQNTLEKSEILP